MGATPLATNSTGGRAVDRREHEPVQLAHVNVSKLQAPLESPSMASFVRALSDVNWLAEHSAGFVWRHRSADGPTVLAALDDVGEVTVTVSVWEGFEPFQQYVYRTAHSLFMQQRARWFEPIGGFTTALWWVAPGTEPSVEEALARLRHLRAHGPRPFAFSLRRLFAPDEVSPVSRTTG